MALQLKGKANYLNKYDYFHDQFKATSKFFNEDDWYKIASGNDSSSLDMYIDALGKAKDIDKIKYDKDYKTEYEDSETRLAALYNEVYGSRIANDDRYAIDVYKYDEAGNMLYDELGNPKTEKVTVSEYEYNKMIINQQNGIKETLHLRDLAREAKDPTIWADVYSGLVSTTAGMLDFFNSVYALGATLIDMASSDKTFANDWFNQWEIRYKPILERLTIEGKTVADHMLDFESKYSHLRDVDGNLTTAGRIVSGVTTTTGEMLASAGLGKLLSLSMKPLGALGAASKSANLGKALTTGAKIGTDVIRTATYYTPIAARSMGETYKQLTANGQSISTAKMFENQAIKTGLEIAIERGLGAALGATGLDKFLFGTKSVGALKSKGATFWKGVGHYALDAGQEGLEEFLQEFSGYFVDFCMEDFEADFSWQNLSDAFIIGAITSGAHSLASIAATKGKVIKTPDGEIKLGKVASAYYNTSMPTFLDDLYKTQKALDDLIYELPTAKRIEELNQKKSDLVKELISVQNEMISNESKAPESNEFNKAKKTEYVKKSQEVASDVGKGFRLTRTLVGDNEALELIEDKNMMGPETAREKKASLVKKIESVQNEINKIANIQEVVDAKVESTGTEMNRFAEALRGVYAAARTVQSVAGEIGEERMKKAAEILQKIEDMGKAGKFNQSEVLKSYDYVSRELQLHGTHVSKSLMKRIKESGITKIKHVFKREDVESGNVDYSNDERRRVGKVVDELLKSDEKLKTVAISEDGKKVAADDETIILPEKEVALGTAQILHDDAEQKLCQAILNYRFHGDVLNRVLKTYRTIVKSDATDSEVIHALLFDESFFFTMLAGDSDKNVPIADTDMYQFLSSLLYIERNVIVDSIRTGVYDNKIKSVKEYMTKSLTYYLMIQPFADYQLDVLSKAQRDSIKTVREGFAVANRIVAGKMSDSDRKFIYDKINRSNLSKKEKDSIGNTIDKGNQPDRRNALIKLDESYRVAFYGSYDGKTYLPTNSIRNQVVNQLLYSYNVTISNMISGLHPEVLNTIKKLYGNVDAKTIVKFLSNQISMKTDGRYAIEITDKDVDYSSGIFESEGIKLKIVDKKSVFESSDPELARRIKEKTHISTSTRHSQMVVKLLSNDAKSKGAGYYTINDVVMNPSLLKETIRANVQREYFEVTPDAVYKYLKSYYAKTEKVTLSLMSDGRVVFADVTPVTGILSDNFTIEKVKAVVNSEIPMSELVNSKYRIPLMEECQIVFSDSPNYYSSILKTGKNRGTKRAVIELSKSSANNLEALKIEFAHELQHLIQEATMMNTGSKADVLSLFDKDTADKIRNEVVKRIPSLFTGVDRNNKFKVDAIVNKFLYYGSGEYAAYGAEASNVSKIYPVLIQERGNNVVLTLPWGESFVSEQSGNKQMIDERLLKTYAVITKIQNGNVSFAEMTQIIDDIFDIDPSIQIPEELRTKVLEAYRTFYGDGGKISFASDETIKSLKNDVKYAGLYGVKSGILINSDVMVRRLTDGDYSGAVKTVLHEMIHSVTKYHIDGIQVTLGKEALDAYLEDGKLTKEIKALSKVEKAALSLIKLHHELEKEQGETKIYPLKDANEMVAELVNPNFRKYLRGKSLLSKIVKAIKSILGFGSDSALSVADRALSDILDYNINEVVNVSDDAYLEAVKNEDWDLVRKQVRALAARNGFYSSELYHGTRQFGFTKLDVKKSQFNTMFFATDSFNLAQLFSGVELHRIEDEDHPLYNHPNEEDTKNIVDASEYFSKDERLNYTWRNKVSIDLTGFVDILRRFLSNHIDHAKLDFYDLFVKVFDTFFDSEFNIDFFNDLMEDFVGKVSHEIHRYLKELDDVEQIDSNRYMNKDSGEVFDVEEQLEELFFQLTHYDSSDSLLLSFKPGIYGLYANLDNSIVIDAKGKTYMEVEYEGSVFRTDELANKCFDEGYDLLIVKNLHHGSEYIFRDPAHQLRSSDLVTYDDNGNVIPLSKRFDPDMEDLRFDEFLGDEDTEDRPVTFIEHSTHQKSKGRTPRKRVPKKASKGTPLEPFAGRRLSLPLQDFIMKSAHEEYSGIDRGIKKKIIEGTLYTADLYEYLRECNVDDPAAEKTFKLINDTIFHNKHITSLKQLDEYILLRTSVYYGLRAMFRGTGYYDKLVDLESAELYDKALELIEADPVLKKRVENISNNYWAGPVISEKNLRRLWMQHFDGSIESGGYIAGVARVIAFQGWLVTGGSVTSQSINRAAGGGKDGAKSSRTVEEMTPDKNDLDDFNRFISDKHEELLSGALEREFVKSLLERKEAGENISLDELYKWRLDNKEYITSLRDSNPSEFWKLYTQYVSQNEREAQAMYIQTLAKESMGKEDATVDEALDKLDREEAMNNAKKVLRPKSYAVANFKSMARTIRSNLNRAQRNRFLKDNYDLFDDDLKIRTSLYQEVRNGVIRLKEPKILFEIEERVRKLSKDVRTGVYSSEDSVKYKKWADRRIRKLENELVKTIASKTKEKTIYVRVGMDEVEVEAVHEVPPAVQRFLDRAIKLYATEGPIADTKVKSLSGKDDVHVKMSCEEFFSLNAETLHHLTQNDVDEITDFYCSTATVTKNPVYSAIELYTLGYFVKMSGSDAVSFTLSDERLNNIENLLEFVAHKAGTDLSVWKSVEKMIRPEETIHKAMLKLCNIELSPNTEGELIKAINSKDLKRMQAAKQRAYEEVKDRYGSKKRTVFERLLRYEQMAMLSGPGTWVRNLGSNALVTGANSLADIIGKILPTSKNHEKLKQYKIMGTKVGSGYAQWVKLNVMDSGLLDMFSDGLIKYDPRQSKKHGVENQLTKLIIDKIQSDLFNYSPKSNKFDKFNSSIQGILRFVMSDKWAINKSFEKYLGKMLTEDKADVSQGLSRKIMNTIADAYVMALQDYMHTKGCFGKIEDALRTYLHKRFNPTLADGIFFMYKQVMPFANASWNWFVEGLNYTPFGLAKGIYNFCRLENTVNAMESARQKGETVRSGRFAEYLAKRNIVKGSIGTAGFIAGVLLAAFGLVELDDDDDKYKLRFNSNDGPFYVDFSNFFGTSGVLWGMSWVQGFIDSDGIDYDSLMKVLSSSLSTMFLDSTLADVFNTFRYSENIGDYLLGVPNDVLGMFFPNFIKTLANVSKKYKNNYRPGFIGKLEKFAVQCFAPFSYMMPYQINPYTGDAEVINEGWFGVNLVNAFTPIKVKNYNFGDTEKNAVLVGVKKGQLSGRYEIDGVKMSLTGEQVSNLNQFYGKLNQRELEDFMNNKTKYTVETESGDRKELTYGKMTDAEKKAVIERIMSNNGQLAKVYILTSNGYKYYASDSEYERLKKAGVISNVYRKQGKYDGFVKS